MSSVIEVRKRILTGVFLDPRTKELLNQSIQRTEETGREYGFEVYLDYFNESIFHTRLVRGTDENCHLEEERSKNPLEGNLLLFVHTHPERPGETIAKKIARSKNANDSSNDDLLSLVDDYREFRRECAELAGTTGSEMEIANRISPISMIVYPVVAQTHLHLYQLTGYIPRNFTPIDEIDAEPTMELMEQLGQLQRMRMTYKRDEYSGLDEVASKLALTEPLQLEAPEESK